MKYPQLFSPLDIGPITVANRVVFGAHFTMFTEPGGEAGEPGYYGQRLGRYLARRARGGAGLVIAGQAQVHPTTAYQMSNNAAAWKAEAVEHFERLTSEVHAEGAKVFLQLAHNGGVNRGDWSKLPVWAPSPVANYNEAPKVLEQHEIREVVEHFGISARNAAAGGFDGIEVHAAHGYLLHEFLSPRSNLRTDGYGGSLEGRMRMAVEVLEAVRAAVGPAKAVGLRLVGDEEQGKAGLGPDEAAEIAARFEELGLADFINVSVGSSGIGMVRPLYSPHLFGVPAATRVREAVTATPVFAVHRILTPAEAEGIIAEGRADAVTLVRALIADPDWAAKARSERSGEIRLCTGSNQGCYGNLLQGIPVSCVQNPTVGRESKLETLDPAATKKRVVVVGGGPAGLEAAWVAAARGHEVTLVEQSGRLGGKVRLAEQLPGRGELRDFADWRAAECARQGVDIRLSSQATAETLTAMSPDAVVVATGGHATTSGRAKWHHMPVSGTDRSFVINHEQALEQALGAESDELGHRIVILDTVGHIEGLGLGELLAGQQREVTLVMPLATPMLLDAETMANALPRAVGAGVTWRPTSALASVGEHEATIVDLLSGRTEVITAVDTVVIRTHGLPNDELYFELAGRVPEVIRVGDAVAVRFVDRAIFDGHMAGRRL
ncbi:MAG: FAD-dependent oxidoreductase [Deltaproteobacteria bacterium]